jgi:putative hydrolase of the HAD superfamily
VDREGVAIFDGDDTLWRVEQLYDDALSRAEQVVAEAGLPADEWRRLQREIDLVNVESMGMSRDRFPLSSKQALEELVRSEHVTPEPSLLERVVQLSRSVFEMTAPLVPGAEDTIRRLRPHFRLVLLTKGDRPIQKKRIADSKLEPLFDQIEIVAEKNSQTFRRLIEEFQVVASHAWSVGNSLPSDINPALNVGLNAIWIDAHVWEHERREVAVDRPGLIVLQALRDVPEVLLRSRAPLGWVAP